jgi:hypothetical protein
MSNRVFILFISFLLLSCQHKKAEYAFYYWKNQDNVYLQDDDDSLASKLGVQHFYIKYLEVGWSEPLKIPAPVVSGDDYSSYVYGIPMGATQKYTPVIFITNRTFERIDSVWCNDSLAMKLKRKINEITNNIETPIINELAYQHMDSIRYALQKQNKDIDYSSVDIAMQSFKDSIQKTRTVPFDEIQIDCDWTVSTRDKYFIFLRSLKKQFPDKIISATIRLYPYKYPDKMGVPPVDKGMLMCYNLGEVDNPETKNSIFDVNELKQYLHAKRYKLPLDIALPIFGWYIWFRDNKVKGLIYPSELSGNVIAQNADSIALHRFQINKDFAVGNNYLREGDVLRQEFPDKDELIKGAKLLRRKFPDVERIAFFDWDNNRVKDYETTIEKIYSMF